MTAIITSPRLLSGDVLLFYVSFLLLLLRHPDSSRVIMYCYSTFLFHYYYYVSPTPVGWSCIVILRFFFTIIITSPTTPVRWSCIAILRFFFTIIITSPRLQSGDHVLLFYVSFSLLLLRHPDSTRVIMYCYSTFLFHYYYYVTPTPLGWSCIAILRFFFTIIITSPRLQSGDHVLLFYVSFSLLFIHTFLSTRFLGDVLIKLYETL